MANPPIIDYTSRDFEGLRQSLLDYAGQAFPEWTPGSEGDFGVLLLELLAYVGDVNSFYVDRAQREAHLGTASQRGSVLQIANLLGYRPSNGTPATGTVTFKTDEAGARVFVPRGTRLATDFIPEIDGQILFETNEDVYVPGIGGTATVAVTEGETKRDEVTGAPEPVGESSGLPNQTFRLPNPRVYEGTTRVFVADEEWLLVESLLDADPGSRVFSTITDQDGYTWLQFGDGLNGAIPALGLPIGAMYRVGFGGRGNLDAGLVVGIVESNLSGVSIERSNDDNNKTTSSAMTGGSDPESTESIRRNAPRVFRTQKRAVTLNDYEDFALGIPGVTQAKAICDFFTSISVFVVGPNGSVPTDALLAQVARDLEPKALAGTTVTVGRATMVPVNFGSVTSPITIEVWPTFSRGVVQFEAEAALARRMEFVNNDLGARLNVSDFYKTLMSVEGVRYVDVPVMARSDTAQTGTSEIQLRAWEFPVLGSTHVTTTGGII